MGTAVHLRRSVTYVVVGREKNRKSGAVSPPRDILTICLTARQNLSVLAKAYIAVGSESVEDLPTTHGGPDVNSDIGHTFCGGCRV